MSQASQAETRKIIAELKALIMEALEILSDKEEPSRNDAIRARANEQGRA